MTWPQDYSEMQDAEMEDEIQKELQLIDVQHDEDLTSSDWLSDAASKESNPDDPVIILQYAARLQQQTAAHEAELLECDGLLAANASEYRQTNGPNAEADDSEQLAVMLPATFGRSAKDEAVRKILAEMHGDDSESDDELAIDWRPLDSAVTQSENANISLNASLLDHATELAPVHVDGTPGSSAMADDRITTSSGIEAAFSEELASGREKAEDARRESAVQRERYEQHASQSLLDRKELRRKEKVMEEESEHGRAVRLAHLQQEEEALKCLSVKLELSLQQELEKERGLLEIYAADFQERMNRLSESSHQEKVTFETMQLESKARQQQSKIAAAVTVQAAFRGHRVRLLYSSILKERLAARRKVVNELRVRAVEAERQAAEDARRRLVEIEEERKREAAEAEAAEKCMQKEQRRLEAEEKERRLAEEEQRKQEVELERAEKAKKQKELKRIEAEQRRQQKRNKQEAVQKLERERKEAEERQHQEVLRQREEERLAEEQEAWRRQEELKQKEEQSRLEEQEQRRFEQEKNGERSTGGELRPEEGRKLLEFDQSKALNHKQLTRIVLKEHNGQRQDDSLDAGVLLKKEVKSATDNNELLANDVMTTAAATSESSQQVLAKPISSGSSMEVAQSGERADRMMNLEDRDERVLHSASHSAEVKVALSQKPSATSSSRTSTVVDAVAMAKRAEERMAEMKSLKTRLESKVTEASGHNSSPSGTKDASRGAPDASHDTSLWLSKMEERRLRWMKECTPWSAIRAAAKSKKPALPRKGVAKKVAGDTCKPVPEKLLLASDSGAASLAEIQTVQLSDLPGYSLMPLTRCKGLKALLLRRCGLTHLDGVDGCTDLIYIDCQDNAIESLTLGALGTLTVLNLAFNGLTSMSGLEACPNVCFLNLSHNKLTRIAGLGFLRSLHTLDLSHNQLLTSRGLADAPWIQHLDVSHNHLSVIEDTEKMCLLETLTAQGNNILEVPKLVSSVVLRRLVLDDNSISTVGGLAFCWLPSLHHLSLSQNSLSTLLPLHGCPLLHRIDLRHNQLVDVRNLGAALALCINLEELLMEGTPAAVQSNSGTDYRNILHSILHHIRFIDGKELAEPREIVATDFLRACEKRTCDAERLDLDWLRDTGFGGGDICKDLLLLCSKCVSYFDRSASLANETRCMHEYGELELGPISADRDGTVGATAPVMAMARSSSSTGIATRASKEGFDAALPAATPVVPDNGKPQSVLSQRDMTKPATSQVRVSEERQRVAAAASGGSDDEEIAAVSIANVMSQRKLSKVVGGSGKNAIKAQPPSTAVADSKEAFEERLRLALENASSQRLSSEGGAQHLRYSGSSIDRVPAKLLASAHKSDSYRSPAIISPCSAKSANSAAVACLSQAATRIQALWRGYMVRKWLNSALLHTREGNLNEDDDFQDYGEVDLSAFDADEAQLEEAWLPPQTPQLPKNYVSLKNPFAAADVMTLSSNGHEPHPPFQPKHAWRNSSAGRGDSAQDGAQADSAVTPVPSVQHTHRSGLSRKEELLADEWGFKDQRTAELMLQRAKKLKYNAAKKKKLSQLDPKQKLAFLRRLEESMGAPLVHVAPKKTLKKEYFEAFELETKRQQFEKMAEDAAREERMYEWVHTQVGQYADREEFGAMERRKAATLEKAAGRHHQRPLFGQDTLPYMEKRVLDGGRAQLVASPLDIQSVESEEVHIHRKRLSEARTTDIIKEHMQFPPIKTSSASSDNARKKERISFRDTKVDLGPGWGGGRKKTSQR